MPTARALPEVREREVRRVVTMTVVACIAGLVCGIAVLWFLFTRGSRATTLSEADFDTEYDELVAEGEAAASDRDAAWRDFERPAGRRGTRAPPVGRGRRGMTGAIGTLVSVNVGLPRDVEWRGRTVHTGIWKEPVDGRCRVGRTNLAGDGQGDLAGHGGEQRAVYVYQLDSYRYWAEHLGRDDFVHGQFGENFTVDGLGDDEVCIGDRYRIGSATFEVTQPRVTCYRLGIRLDQPRMPALLVADGRPGFYLRVLDEGEVGAGDAITKVALRPGADDGARAQRAALRGRATRSRRPAPRACASLR